MGMGRVGVGMVRNRVNNMVRNLRIKVRKQIFRTKEPSDYRAVTCLISTYASLLHLFFKKTDCELITLQALSFENNW